MAREHVKTLIIGSGPAGYTAAIYASRANLSPVLYQGPQPGGQLTITNDVENFPGYPKGVMGPQMMMELQEQAKRFGTDIRTGFVTGVQLNENGPHIATVNDEIEIEADSVIISTGASAKWLGLESETRLNGSGVSACAVCDGFFYRGQEVVVVGAGDSAAEEAHYLSNLCSKVHLLVRRDEMRASKIMQERVIKKDNIEIHWNTETLEVLGDNEVEGVKVFNNKTKEESVINVTGFFVAIGHKPNTDIFKGQLDMDNAGYLITQPDSTKTNIKGVFAAGDVQDTVYRQAVTAAGTGCMAALEAERYLVELED
ncbi:thioredoxin-disulfide reductase [Flammeovirga kamogawensis]|uniref:Thioredoxin reductase n=1 Tax=Flammeovirga kamogawensis TaxID=373891 RepID=A0ABX8GVC1_9BACT|nr:thioredoxin-disulfide reductase [Flammeovirga kamogawensis]MBB6459844.1 thioredoxin reductase (NADPH) [Flammeovirga kamogawensis]QWG07102.1 thioredoxin-disulfide reductase [Flammeovirga kamogawensis]TRX68923.1 thioredoxin-disulfide reductase [Flammeovirga kamogawensis]